MKTYNVNDRVNFTQFGITLNGTIVKVGKMEADGTGYYVVEFGKHNSKAVVSTDEIEEGRFSAIVSFLRDGIKKSVELCGMESAMEYIDSVIEPNGWTLEGCVIGTRY